MMMRETSVSKQVSRLIAVQQKGCADPAKKRSFD
jgi:hypothetical protein